MKSMTFKAFTPVTDDEELHLPALIQYSALGDIDEVTFLLEEGVDPNLTDDEGYSALQAAAENGYLEVVQLLIEKGANHLYKSEYTAIQLAEMAEHFDIVNYLKNL